MRFTPQQHKSCACALLWLIMRLAVTCMSAQSLIAKSATDQELQLESRAHWFLMFHVKHPGNNAKNDNPAQPGLLVAFCHFQDGSTHGLFFATADWTTEKIFIIGVFHVKRLSCARWNFAFKTHLRSSVCSKMDKSANAFRIECLLGGALTN